MPRGLAPVSMGRVPRRRFIARAALGAALVLLSLLAPVETMPGPLPDLGGAHAGAQTPPPPPVETGTPDPCETSPAPYTPQSGDAGYLTSSECVLELPACPESPLHPGTGTFMRLSAPPAGLEALFPTLDVDYPDIPGLETYPDFCEERVLDSDPTYSTCLNMTGYVVMQYTDGGQNGCRLLHPIKCPAGLYMATSRTCRAVHRRTWTCPAGQMPRNEFNSCYRLQTAAPVPHPACRTGSPDFVAKPCEDYVGNDFLTNAATVNCQTTYVTGTPVQYPAGTVALTGAPAVEMQPSYRTGTSSIYWCSYDTRFLDPDCHRTNIVRAKCAAASMALCIKRASQTGGCDAIAETIRCRAYEAAFRQQRAVPLAEVRLNGCTPCVILPFRRVPNRCPRDTRARPRPGRPSGLLGQYSENSDLVVILREEADFAMTNPDCMPVRDHGASLDDHSDCARRAVCADPPSGSIDWEPTHISGVAVVNMPVIVTVADLHIDHTVGTARHYYYSSTDSDDPPIRVANSYFSAEYTGSADEDPRVRTWAEIDPLASPSAPDQIPRGTIDDPGGECALADAPRFKLIAQELWPDNGPDYDDNDPDCVVPPGGDRPGSDAEAILELFGRDSLRWWCNLSEGERLQRTLARDLPWWDDPMTDQAQRTEDLTQEADCDYTTTGETIWCRWVPSRPGFYSLKAGGAWTMVRYLTRAPAVRLPVLLNWLNDATDGADRRNRLQQELNTMGRTAADIGVSDLTSPPVTALPPPISTPDWMYSEAAGTEANCPAVDLRIYCQDTASGNYTETEPIGIIVHEMRVSTVTPSN